MIKGAPDPAAMSRGFAHVIDESGKDYHYPSEYFVAVEIPLAATGAFFGAS